MNYSPILIIIILVAALIFYRQIISMFNPIKGKGTRIIATLFLLTPGYALIMNPNAEVTPTEITVALLVGCVFSAPLIFTTGYERREDGRIYVKKSLAFVVTFLLLFAIRWTIRGLIDMDSDSRMLLFFVTACGYLIPWKVSSYFRFRNVYISK
ncbi:cytochrome c biogenesis protein CcdC [Lederbergia panacisoli]|uniref:cytochrome c biogenesis protein CcdC n=1 Tax=Lederbergia panacisoli TaxID=1255251 RepID=UPI00214AB875|nr:cytochrome c biogenesis protein CcdC [Lederbergia panacisoli]MCR2822309.1 cytochrome c biogenesis protein CcdC [Lederbergia panacisoli]